MIQSMMNEWEDEQGDEIEGGEEGEKNCEDGEEAVAGAVLFFQFYRRQLHHQ